jgi:hypothetical protein
MDGQMECLNQELEKYLWTYINAQKDDWSEWLSTVEFTYNDTQHSATGYTPFYLNLGWHPNRVPEPKPTGTSPAVDDFAETLARARRRANKALIKVKEKMKQTFDKRHAPSIQWKPGDWVWIDQLYSCSHTS